MARTTSITTLFLDIGGVLLTNGWDWKARQIAAETFHLEHTEFDERHHLTFDTYEEGKLNLDEYLDRVVFYQERAFSREDFRAFMFSRSQPYPDMLELVRALKKQRGLRVVAVSNGGRELTPLSYPAIRFTRDFRRLYLFLLCIFANPIWTSTASPWTFPNPHRKR
jgi:putative hydrolase of the HAD superfamily